MESSLEENTINNKYNILRYKSHGATSKVYLVEDKNDKKQYAAKVFKEDSSTFKDEIKIMEKISALKNPFIINLIESGEGPIKKFSKPKKIKKYVILEYASKGTI